jgi:transketolase
LGDTSSFEKWRSIGFDIIEIDGHDFNQIDESIQYMKTRKNSHPKLIICNTVKGKGVDFMENKLEWHYLPMNAEQYIDALVSIEKNKYEK